MAPRAARWSCARSSRPGGGRWRRMPGFAATATDWLVESLAFRALYPGEPPARCERTKRHHRPRVPILRRAVAARHEPAGPLSLLVLPPPLRAALGVPALRRALDDRADVRHRRRDLPQLRRIHAAAHLARWPPAPRRPGCRSRPRCRTAARP